MHAITDPHRHPRIPAPRCCTISHHCARDHWSTSPSPRASLPRCEVLDFRGLRPGRAVVVFNQQHPRTPPTTKHPLAHASTARAPGLTITAQDQWCCARNATRAAPAPLGPPCTTARTQRFSLSCRTSHAVPTARGGLAARMAPFFSSSGFPPFSWPAVLSFYLLSIAPRATPARMHARSLQRGDKRK